MEGTSLGEAVGKLIVTAFFFAMRSCEYSTVQGNRRTFPIRLGDVEFRHDGRTLRSKDVSVLSAADTVLSVKYRTQKNGDRGTVVTQHRTETAATTNEALCPVRALAHLVARIANYEVCESKWQHIADRPINLVQGEQTASLTEITSAQVLHHLRAAAVQYGEDRLGFSLKKLGTHSLRSGAATAMFIAGVPVETIKLIGRWRGDTFMRYIRTQVQQITRGVATEMTTSPEIVTIG